MRIRTSNYRNHIKIQHKGCEISTHFKELKECHALPDNSKSIQLFNKHLGEQIQFSIIDKVDFPPDATTAEKKALIAKPEAYWQTQLRTMKKYGGLNVRDERLVLNSKLAKGNSSRVTEQTSAPNNQTKNNKPSPKILKLPPKTNSTVPPSQPNPSATLLENTQECSETQQRSQKIKSKNLALPR